MSDRVLYEVQEIIGRKVFSGKVLYLVKWKDFPREQATWQSVKLLKNVKHLVKQYHDKNKGEIARVEQEQLNDPTATPNKRKRGKTADQKEELDREMFYEEEDEKQGKGHFDSGEPEQKPSNVARLPSSSNDPSATVQKMKSPASRPQQSVFPQSKPVKSQTTKEVEKTNEPSSKDEGIILKKIYFLEKTAENELQYLVEETNGTFRKCLAKDLVHKYPRELVKYLEEALLCRLGK